MKRWDAIIAINDKETQWRTSKFKLMVVVKYIYKYDMIGDIVLLSYVNREKSDGNDLEQE